MTSIQSISTSSSFSATATQGSSRAHRHRPEDSPQFQALFQQDLTDSGLKAGVSEGDLLKSIQSSIKTAISDPANANKDVFQVAQDAVKKTLKDNGVDPDKLSSLLQTQIGQQPGQGGAGLGGAGRGASFGPEGGPPPGGLPPIGAVGRHHHHGGQPDGDADDADAFGSNSTSGSNSSSTGSTSSTSTSSTTASVAASTVQPTSTTQSNSATDNNAQSDRYKSRFERIIADLIKSLPSGSTLDLKA